MRKKKPLGIKKGIYPLCVPLGTQSNVWLEILSWAYFSSEKGQRKDGYLRVQCSRVRKLISCGNGYPAIRYRAIEGGGEGSLYCHFPVVQRTERGGGAPRRVSRDMKVIMFYYYDETGSLPPPGFLSPPPPAAVATEGEEKPMGSGVRSVDPDFCCSQARYRRWRRHTYSGERSNKGEKTR